MVNEEALEAAAKAAYFDRHGIMSGYSMEMAYADAKLIIQNYEAAKAAQECIQNPPVCIEEGEKKIQTDQTSPGTADERAAFEALWEKEIGDIPQKHEDGGYLNASVVAAFATWQAARDHYLARGGALGRKATQEKIALLIDRLIRYDRGDRAVQYPTIDEFMAVIFPAQQTAMTRDNEVTDDPFLNAKILWQEYAMADDAILSEDGKALKRQLLGAVAKESEKERACYEI